LALCEARRRLSIAGVPEPRAEALGLLAWASGIRREALLAHGDDALDDGALDRFEGAMARRVGREPFAYIVGEREFFGLSFSVDRRVLIPRPESELLVELALEWLGTCTRESPLVVDVGTGSGALACAVAVHAPWCRVIGVDVSVDALAVAHVNRRALAASSSDHGAHVRPVQGDLLGPVAGPIDVVMANLPYLPRESIDGLQPEVGRHEPRLALDGGRDGLDLILRCLDHAGEKLASDGLALFEIEPFQVDAIAQRATWATCTVHRDLAGLDRVVALRRR
jgi:release factor glutamine methyltransferase